MVGSEITSVPVTSTVVVQPTRVLERIKEACANVGFDVTSFVEDVNLGTAPVDRPTLLAASRHFTLNTKQHYAFVLIASSVLMCLLRRIEPDTLPEAERHELRAAKETVECIYSTRRGDECIADDPVADRERLFAFITGAAGSGKSRVISAVTDFARRWDCSNIICLTATSGAAAALISARTWHSATGLNVDTAGDEKVGELLPPVWSPIGVMIIDEIGMMGANSLMRLDKRLRLLKPESADLRFGGVHVIGFGDLRQLKPVCEPEMFNSMNRAENIASREEMAMASASQMRSDSKSSSSAAAASAARHKPVASAVKAGIYLNAYELWTHGMNAGIELEENKRAESDPAWADSLSRWSANRPTLDDINLVNRCLISIDDPEMDPDRDSDDDPIVDCDRADRLASVAVDSNCELSTAPRRLPSSKSRRISRGQPPFI